MKRIVLVGMLISSAAFAANGPVIPAGAVKLYSNTSPPIKAGDVGIWANGNVAKLRLSGGTDDTFQLKSERNAANGYAGLDGSSKLTGSQQVYGSTSNTAAQGNDGRLSDDRTASGLRTATTVVTISGDTAPTLDQVLRATSGTAATWQTLNFQAPGNYITALTGDASAAGPGSVALTLATVNGNVGTFGDASHSVTLTANAKGLITAVSAPSILITESQVTNLVSDLAGKVPNTRTLTAGAGLTGGGDLSADRTFDVGAGFGIAVAANSVAVDETVDYTWTGIHTFTHAATAVSIAHSASVGTTLADGLAVNASVTTDLQFSSGPVERVLDVALPAVLTGIGTPTNLAIQGVGGQGQQDPGNLPTLRSGDIYIRTLIGGHDSTKLFGGMPSGVIGLTTGDGGDGGDGTISFPSDGGGNAGGIALTTGKGGTAGPTHGSAGGGGPMTFTLGDGGNAVTGSTGFAGSAPLFWVKGGRGGNGSPTVSAGDGSSIRLSPGLQGIDNGGGGGNDGQIQLDADVFFTATAAGSGNYNIYVADQSTSLQAGDTLNIDGATGGPGSGIALSGGAGGIVIQGGVPGTSGGFGTGPNAIVSIIGSSNGSFPGAIEIGATPFSSRVDIGPSAVNLLGPVLVSGGLSFTYTTNHVLKTADAPNGSSASGKNLKITSGAADQTAGAGTSSTLELNAGASFNGTGGTILIGATTAPPDYAQTIHVGNSQASMTLQGLGGSLFWRNDGKVVFNTGPVLINSSASLEWYGGQDNTTGPNDDPNNGNARFFKLAGSNATGGNGHGGNISTVGGNGFGTNQAGGSNTVDAGIPTGTGAALVYLGPTNATRVLSGSATCLTEVVGDLNFDQTLYATFSGAQIGFLAANDATDFNIGANTPAALSSPGVYLNLASGDGSATSGAAAGGEAGHMGVTGGNGGSGDAGHASGKGGLLSLFSGNAGAANGGPGASAGKIDLDTGTSTGAAALGTIDIGKTSAGFVNVARAGAVITLKGQIAASTGGGVASVGANTLSAGSFTVSTTAVHTGSQIFLNHMGTGTVGNIGTLYVGTIVNGTSFVINSTNGADNDSVSWLVIN